MLEWYKVPNIRILRTLLSHGHSVWWVLKFLGIFSRLWLSDHEGQSWSLLIISRNTINWPPLTDQTKIKWPKLMTGRIEIYVNTTHIFWICSENLIQFQSTNKICFDFFFFSFCHIILYIIIFGCGCSF